MTQKYRRDSNGDLYAQLDEWTLYIPETETFIFLSVPDNPDEYDLELCNCSYCETDCPNCEPETNDCFCCGGAVYNIEEIELSQMSALIDAAKHLIPLDKSKTNNLKEKENE